VLGNWGELHLQGFAVGVDFAQGKIGLVTTALNNDFERLPRPLGLPYPRFRST
jgi:hypothetical protein